LRGLQQRSEVDAPHGKLALGILVFQDLAVVPIMLVIPLLAGAEQGPVWLPLVRAAIIIVVVMVAARLLIPPLLRQVARTRQRQLFILAVFVIAVGTAWLITSAGASLAVGAFLAGLVVAGSAFREQAVADIISFKEVFSSLFFVSVGMVLSPAALLDGAGTISWMLAAVLVGKFLIVAMVGLAMRLPLRVSLLAGVALCQVGEFALVIMRAAAPHGILSPDLNTNLTAVAIMSMLITPFALAFGPHLAAGAQKVKWLGGMMKIESTADVAPSVKGHHEHVIIGGFGFAGRELARALDACRMPYVVAELNAETVLKAQAADTPAVYADITSPEVLHNLGLQRARQFVIAVNDPSATELAIKAARSISSRVKIIARTNYLLDIDLLEQAGADLVIPAEREAAVEVVRQVLKRCEVCDADIVRLSEHVQRRE
jgi:CPA2 family monovalent cation:H+ antiporter-2